MEPAPSFHRPTLAEQANRLKAHLREDSQCHVELRKRFLRETVRNIDASEMIGLVDLLGDDVGTLLNIELFKAWLETWAGLSKLSFAIWYNLGVQYGVIADTDNAITCYKNALALKPDLYQASLNLGTAFETQGKLDLALAAWKAALQPVEARTALLNNRGRTLEGLKRYDEAVAEFESSLLADPKQPAVLHHWIGLRTRMCAWPIFTSAMPGVSRADMMAATRALTLLALVDDVTLQDQGNRSWIEEKHPPAPLRLSPEEGYRHRKLRIGYLSSDFCMHPIAYLVAELFERHDREHFEIYGYCSTKDDGSDVRRRIITSFDRFADIRSMSDERAARLIRDDEIDILIDLNGLTLGTRLQVLRWRPAPVQMTYLGYNGPVPLPELDYIIADDYVIPSSLAATHRPRPLYVNACYQVNDRHLDIAVPPTRREIGLPDDTFVFCCFSNTYKITESMFALWMEIIRRTEHTVLWLFADNHHAIHNLRQQAVRAGIDESRIIFAARVEPSQYRARLALADLFLDTFPYNAGTTASDALRVGLPLITLSGASFISRMAGSILSAMNLSECIVLDEESYVNLAIDLATNQQRYRDLRQKITPETWLDTLGDTSGFCRNLENAFKSVAAVAEASEIESELRAQDAFELIIH